MQPWWQTVSQRLILIPSTSSEEVKTNHDKAYQTRAWLHLSERAMKKHAGTETPWPGHVNKIQQKERKKGEKKHSTTGRMQRHHHRGCDIFNKFVFQKSNVWITRHWNVGRPAPVSVLLTSVLDHLHTHWVWDTNLLKCAAFSKMRNQNMETNKNRGQSNKQTLKKIDK